MKNKRIKIICGTMIGLTIVKIIADIIDSHDNIIGSALLEKYFTSVITESAYMDEFKGLDEVRLYQILENRVNSGYIKDMIEKMANVNK